MHAAVQLYALISLYSDFYSIPNDGFKLADPEEPRNFSISVFNDPPVPESEDCLYLNVYTPAKLPPPGGWPVMFWLFGGSLQYGSASVLAYDGQYLAGYHDMVVVGANYRTNGMSDSLIYSC